MFNIPTHRIAVMVDDNDSQVPTVALTMGIVAYTRMIESLAFLAIQGNAFGALLYGRDGTVAPGALQHTRDNMPALMHEGREVQWPVIEETDLSRFMWPLAQLVEYAKFRNRMENKTLVGDDNHTIPLVYAALRVIHEYRCEDVRRTIMKIGPMMGYATPFHTENWKEHVQTWPERWNFRPLFWTPLMDEVEGNPHYTGALAEWEHKMKAKA